MTPTYQHITDELVNARSKFPGTGHNFDALVEEVGELAKALLEQHQEPSKGIKSKDVYAEAIQCAVMAIRVAEEGDKNYPRYLPETGSSTYKEE